MVHDGMKIRSTTANLRIVGNCFPFKYQQKRDLDLGIDPRVEELEDDDEDLIVNVGSVAEELERPSALSCRGVEDLLDKATQEHDEELRSIFAFVGRENTEAGEHLKRRIVKSKGKGRALLKSKRKVTSSSSPTWAKVCPQPSNKSPQVRVLVIKGSTQQSLFPGCKD